MNEFKQFLQFGILFCFLINYGLSLRCYTCDSRNNSRCAETWSVEKPEKYVKTCNSTFETSCRKFVINMLNVAGTVVVRECFGPKNLTSKYKPNECRDDENGLVACYCTSDLCNGQPGFIPSRILPLLLFALPSIVGFFIL